MNCREILDKALLRNTSRVEHLASLSAARMVKLADAIMTAYEAAFDTDAEAQPRGLAQDLYELHDQVKDLLANERALANALKDALSKVDAQQAAINQLVREQAFKIEKPPSDDVVVLRAPEQTLQQLNRSVLINVLRSLIPRARGFLVLSNDDQLTAEPAKDVYLVKDHETGEFLVFQAWADAQVAAERLGCAPESVKFFGV